MILLLPELKSTQRNIWRQKGWIQYIIKIQASNSHIFGAGTLVFAFRFMPKKHWRVILHKCKTLYSMSVDVCWQSMQEDDDWRQWLCCTLADPSLFLHTIRKSRKPQLGRSVIALLQWYKATGHMYHSGRWQWSLVPKGIFHIFAQKLQKPLRKYCC